MRRSTLSTFPPDRNWAIPNSFENCLRNELVKWPTWLVVSKFNAWGKFWIVMLPLEVSFKRCEKIVDRDPLSDVAQNFPLFVVPLWDKILGIIMVVNFAGHKGFWISENNIIGRGIEVPVSNSRYTVECFLSGWIGGLSPQIAPNYIVMRSYSNSLL